MKKKAFMDPGANIPAASSFYNPSLAYGPAYGRLSYEMDGSYGNRAHHAWCGTELHQGSRRAHREPGRFAQLESNCWTHLELLFAADVHGWKDECGSDRKV